MKTPLVSIITVVYNGEKFLQQTIDSVVNQTYKNIEYLIVDGGSNDGTLDIIEKNNKNISKWISGPDNGLYDAMNKGIKMSSGDIIGTINSDDWYEIDAVETIVKAYNNNPQKLIFHGDRYNIFKNGERQLYRFNPSALKFKYYNMTYSHPSMFVCKEEYNGHLYDTSLKSFSDYQFVLEAYMGNPNKFFYVGKPIVNFRLGGISGQVSYLQDLREGFEMRKNAGMTLTENIFSFIFRAITRGIINVFNFSRKL